MKSPKKLVVSALLGLLLAGLAVVPFPVVSPSPVTAQSAITLSSSVETAFPNSMTFKVKAQSSIDIVKLRLNYTVERQNLAKVVSEGWAQFSPAPSVDTRWLWDMRKGGLPPGARVEYWWTAEDASGKRSQTTRSTTSFDDNRYQWQSITTGPVTLLWYSGDRNFANALMNAAQQGLQKIQNDTGAVPQRRVRIYIYASAGDLQGAHLFAPQWEGGVSFTNFDIIAIGVPTNQLGYGIRTVPHELTHWLVGQVTFNSYDAGLPVWLNEGLATYGEGPELPDYQAALTYAINNNMLFSVRSLSSPFSAIPLQAYISYAQSNSIVTFLIQKYGKEKMQQLLDTFRRGSTYDGALKQVYGFDQDGLDALWRESIGLKPVKTLFLPQRELNLALAGA
ncbi:MAG: peptidase MA domain-containing protein [Chloroflexi bacterium]|nr:peptidase MA domain-containing protein [Chloroflexota bacterium]